MIGQILFPRTYSFISCSLKHGHYRKIGLRGPHKHGPELGILIVVVPKKLTNLKRGIPVC